MIYFLHHGQFSGWVFTKLTSSSEKSIKTQMEQSPSFSLLVLPILQVDTLSFWFWIYRVVEKKKKNLSFTFTCPEILVFPCPACGSVTRVLWVIQQELTPKCSFPLFHKRWLLSLNTKVSSASSLCWPACRWMNCWVNSWLPGPEVSLQLANERFPVEENSHGCWTHDRWNHPGGWTS